MIVLIESALVEFNEAFKKPVLKEGTAGAVLRVDDIEDRTCYGLLD